jgi:hypothetical protein
MIPTKFHLVGSTQDKEPISFVLLIYTTVTFYGLAFQLNSTKHEICNLLSGFLDPERSFLTTPHKHDHQNGSIKTSPEGSEIMEVL